MTTFEATPARISTRSTKIGWVLSGLIIVFMLFDSVTKLAGVQAVKDSMIDLGFAPHAGYAIGATLLVVTALYAIPRTAILGAVLMTGYLGGAVTANLRVEAPLLSTQLFAVYVGIVMWLGVYLRDARVRTLI